MIATPQSSHWNCTRRSPSLERQRCARLTSETSRIAGMMTNPGPITHADNGEIASMTSGLSRPLVKGAGLVIWASKATAPTTAMTGSITTCSRVVARPSGKSSTISMSASHGMVPSGRNANSTATGPGPCWPRTYQRSIMSAAVLAPTTNINQPSTAAGRCHRMMAPTTR